MIKKFAKLVGSIFYGSQYMNNKYTVLCNSLTNEMEIRGVCVRVLVRVLPVLQSILYRIFPLNTSNLCHYGCCQTKNLFRQTKNAMSKRARSNQSAHYSQFSIETISAMILFFIYEFICILFHIEHFTLP